MSGPPQHSMDSAMRRTRSAPQTNHVVPVERFRTAEEAWLWFIRCEEVRRDGARLAAGPGEVCRPCDPDDIYRAVVALWRARRLGRRHLRILAKFGQRGIAPDRRLAEERLAARLWDEALDRLATVLRRKGILT
jgi:hypothetical protein